LTTATSLASSTNRRKFKRPAPGSAGIFAGGNYFCVLLAAAAMRFGVKITKEQRQYLKSQYKICGLVKEGIEQMAKALERYKDGKPYKPEEPTRTGQVREIAARRVDNNWR
jgi:hypothetical protein